MKIERFFASIFQNISKTAESILIKKIERNHSLLVYKNALTNEHRKNDILRDINDFVKVSVSTLVSMLSNFVYALAQNLV